MEWIPHGTGTGQSSLLSGSGTYLINSLDITGLDAPTDGLIVIRFDLSFNVESFNDDIIWNATTASATQLRGGRIVLAGREGLSEEHFINRAQTRIRNLLFFDTDGEASFTQEVGSGIIEIFLDPFVFGAKYCDRILYGLEPGVSGRVRILASYMVIQNPDDLYRFQLETY